LSRFTDEHDRFWVWDKIVDRVFLSSPVAVAVESDFYKIHDFVPLGHDPYLMEKQLAGMERQVAAITGQWLEWLRTMKPREKVEIPAINRQIVSRFISLQFLRTADTRDTFIAWHTQEFPDQVIDELDKIRLHTEMIWNMDLVNSIAEYVEKAFWIFARNETGTPFVTSDNPVAFRTNDNRMWLKAGFIDTAYVVYPLSPDVVMYCHGREHWSRIERLDRCLSPVELTTEMIESENSGQVFMARRFLLSPINDFVHARDFAATIGTDKYANY